MSSKVTLGRKYKNLSKVLGDENQKEVIDVPQISITEILKDTLRKEAISNNDRFDRIKKEIITGTK
ncbi:hypothetical protein NNC19_16845 [Clostridium sp. SHJSY1]|uniref:hypothetical protein n=1 Tax=Clostridium sp. SHJSY1 TaxID=2942483 RepID=UPI0028742006|nr:hypothetical protein [Clostridium sp. SHJSY1]MDS0527360.1 hypothetical protein [Clostridium sp. SHJSY1]